MPPSAESSGALVFNATSGLMPIASAQTIKDSGPIPEGLYKFKAQIDPLRSNIAQANALGDRAVDNSRDGIQFLPVGGLGPTTITGWNSSVDQAPQLKYMTMREARR
jgi:hypothetical protein